MFKLVAKVADDIVGHPPERKITGVILPVTGNVVISTVLVWDLEELPCRPCIAIPDEFQKGIILQELFGAFIVQKLRHISRQVQIGTTLFDQLSGQGVEQRQPCQIAVLRNGDDRLGKNDDEICFVVHGTPREIPPHSLWHESACFFPVLEKFF